jgi:adenylate cyclase
MPTGTVTFLFTDIQGSTKLWETQPEAMRSALARHDALLRQSIGQHRGHIFKTGGDSFYAAFGTAPDGLAAALAAQQALHAEPWPEPARIRVRMSLHSGPAELRDGDYYGPPLNRVARLMAAAHGGQTLVSDATRGLCGDMLRPGTLLKPLGEHALRDLPQPEPVFQLCHPGLPESFPPLRTMAIVDATPSIAVLPFSNLSQDEENEYFAEGLSEELLNVLARIRGVRVASRTSAWNFKGKEIDVRDVAQKLNVVNLLTGSVRKAGKRVRISAQLVDAQQDSNLWSNSYDRELDDIFAVQDDIAQAVVTELREALLGAQPGAAENAQVKAEVTAAGSGRSQNADAYTFYLQGQFFRSHLTREGTAKAVECYERALALDPEYAFAWAGLSRALVDQAGQSWVPPVEAYGRAVDAAERAVALGPSLPETHTAMGWVRMHRDWDWKGADTSFRRALDLAPGSTLAMNGAGTLIGCLGRLDEACGLFRRAVELDPLNVSLNRNLGLYCLANDALEEADVALNDTLQLSPRSGLTYFWLALVRLQQGRPDDALAMIEKEVNEVWQKIGVAVVQHASGNAAESDAALAEVIEKYGHEAAYQVAEMCAFRGETDRAFEWLERTYEQRDPGIAYMKMDLLLRNLHADPRWRPFLHKMGLAD